MPSPLSQTSSKTQSIPTWTGPILPKNINLGLPIALVNPNATSSPLIPGPVFPSASSLNSSINSYMAMLFGTRPGERIYLSTYGSNLDAMVFEQLDPTSTQAIQAEITNAIQSFIPGVIVLGVTVNSDESNNQVTFIVSYQITGDISGNIYTYNPGTIAPIALHGQY